VAAFCWKAVARRAVSSSTAPFLPSLKPITHLERTQRELERQQLNGRGCEKCLRWLALLQGSHNLRAYAFWIFESAKETTCFGFAQLKAKHAFFSIKYGTVLCSQRGCSTHTHQVYLSTSTLVKYGRRLKIIVYTITFHSIVRHITEFFLISAANLWVLMMYVVYSTWRVSMGQTFICC
jgi:hypothetical protein